MNMTRRTFFFYPIRPVGEDLENVGEWLQRKGRKGMAHVPGARETEVPGGQMPAQTIRGIGLKNARANLRRKDNEQ